MSLGRYGVRLTQDGIDEILVAAETGLQRVKDAGTTSGRSPELAAS